MIMCIRYYFRGSIGNIFCKLSEFYTQVNSLEHYFFSLRSGFRLFSKLERTTEVYNTTRLVFLYLPFYCSTDSTTSSTSFAY